MRHVRLAKEMCFLPHFSRGSSDTSAFLKPVCASTWKSVRVLRPYGVVQCQTQEVWVPPQTQRRR